LTVLTRVRAEPRRQVRPLTWLWKAWSHHAPVRAAAAGGT